MFATKLRDRLFRLPHLAAQAVQALAQPKRGTPGGVIAGIELIDDISISDRISEARRLDPIFGCHRNRNHIAALDPLHIERGTQPPDRAQHIRWHLRIRLRWFLSGRWLTGDPGSDQPEQTWRYRLSKFEILVR